MEKENQRIILTKRLLKEALIRLLRKKNIDKISVTELCSEAGINRATFYRHYEIPKDVLCDIDRELVANFMQHHSLPHNAEESRRFIWQVCDYMDEHVDLLRILMQSSSDSDLLNVFHDIYAAGIQDILAQFHFPRQLDSESIKILSGYGAAGGYYVLRQWLLGDIKKTSSEIAELICELLFFTDWQQFARQAGLPLER